LWEIMTFCGRSWLFVGDHDFLWEIMPFWEIMTFCGRSWRFGGLQTMIIHVYVQW